MKYFVLYFPVYGKGGIISFSYKVANSFMISISDCRCPSACMLRLKGCLIRGECLACKPIPYGKWDICQHSNSPGWWWRSIVWYANKAKGRCKKIKIYCVSRPLQSGTLEMINIHVAVLKHVTVCFFNTIAYSTNAEEVAYIVDSNQTLRAVGSWSALFAYLSNLVQ